MNFLKKLPLKCSQKKFLDASKLVLDDPTLIDFAEKIKERHSKFERVEAKLIKNFKDLRDFSNGHKYYGIKKIEDSWIFREWAPNATEIFLVGDFSDWNELDTFRMKKINDNGDFELILPESLIKHGNLFKLKVKWDQGTGERIPAYANFVTQDDFTKIFSSKIWSPENPYIFKNKSPDNFDPPVIYEAHVGMGQSDMKVGTYKEFQEKILPRIVKAGYNTLQLMAIQEHPYYGSFGYQVSNFFAPSSRSGTPDELKELIDVAHGMGLKVIMDIIHSHAVKNEMEGLSLLDGTSYQYFHEGGRGNHDAWDTKCFNYEKDQVIHFLLSNIKYWMEEFKFDGFRFDGVTSMLYYHHGLGKHFSSYDDYYNHEIDEDAIIYLTLANKLIHQINPNAISIAEDVSGMPGLAAKLEDGGIGFDYRLSMGIPDFWIKTLKEVKDEDLSVDNIFYELTNRRKNESVITYVESHDQALVGDKTIIFHLVDSEMYWNFSKDRRNHVVDRGIALHKLLRMITISLGKGGYLNFMGNEFGHPEWIDFPREGNNWSYQYARRQWNLVDDPNLCYEFLSNFDREMILFIRENNILGIDDTIKLVWSHCDDKIIAFEREKLLFVFNFHYEKSYTDYMINMDDHYNFELMFHSDKKNHGGFERLQNGFKHDTVNHGSKSKADYKLPLYIPSRTVQVFRRFSCDV